MPEKRKVIYRYECSICGKIHEALTEEEAFNDALSCEKIPVEQPTMCKIGDIIDLWFWEKEAVKIDKIEIGKGNHEAIYCFNTNTPAKVAGTISQKTIIWLNEQRKEEWLNK